MGIKHEPHSKIHIHYRGMHAFHLQYAVARAILIFSPFASFVHGVKACFHSLYLNSGC